VFEAYGDTEIAPLLIDSLITATVTFCDFFLFSCYFCLTVISRGPILRIQIRGTYIPKRATVERITARLVLDATKPGSKLKNRREVPAPRRIEARYLHNGWC